MCVSNLRNVLCTVNTQHTSRQDAIITVRLYLAIYNLIVIIASCLDVCCVLTVHNILYNYLFLIFLLLPTFFQLLRLFCLVC